MTKIRPPNYTQIPNPLIDDHMPAMGEAELKVSMAIARKTFGWHKEHDRISLSQLRRLTGLSKQGVINGVVAGEKRGIIRREKDGQGFYYSLVVHEVDQQLVHEVDQQLVHEVDQQLVHEVDQQLVHEVDTQKKLLKKEQLKKSVEQSNNAKIIVSVEEATNQPTTRARKGLTDTETNSGWLVGSSPSEEISLNGSEANHSQNQPAKERAAEPDPPRANEEYPREAGGALESEADPAMLALLDDEQVRIGNPAARADLLRAAGNLDGLLHLVGYTFDQSLLGKVADFSGFLVGIARNGYEPPRELSPAFVKSDIFARHAPEDISAAASAQQGDGYRVPEEFADLVVG